MLDCIVHKGTVDGNLDPSPAITVLFYGSREKQHRSYLKQTVKEEGAQKRALEVDCDWKFSRLERRLRQHGGWEELVQK